MWLDGFLTDPATPLDRTLRALGQYCPGGENDSHRRGPGDHAQGIGYCTYDVAPPPEGQPDYEPQVHGQFSADGLIGFLSSGKAFPGHSQHPMHGWSLEIVWSSASARCSRCAQAIGLKIGIAYDPQAWLTRTLATGSRLLWSLGLTLAFVIGETVAGTL